MSAVVVRRDGWCRPCTSCIGWLDLCVAGRGCPGVIGRAEGRWVCSLARGRGRLRAFYQEQLGFPLDVDYGPRPDFRVVQLTPPGSACSVQIGVGITAAQPGSVKGLYLVVTDLQAAWAELAGRGVEVGEIRHKAPVETWQGGFESPASTRSGGTMPASRSSPTSTATCGRCRNAVFVPREVGDRGAGLSFCFWTFRAVARAFRSGDAARRARVMVWVPRGHIAVAGVPGGAGRRGVGERPERHCTCRSRRSPTRLRHWRGSWARGGAVARGVRVTAAGPGRCRTGAGGPGGCIACTPGGAACRGRAWGRLRVCGDDDGLNAGFRCCGAGGHVGPMSGWTCGSSPARTAWSST